MKKIFKRISDIFKTRAFIGSLIFAVALWGYTSLSGEYSTIVEVPLEVELPPDRALEAPLPENVSVEVNGMGWTLFTLIYFNPNKKCEIDLTKINIKDTIYQISRTQIQKGLKSIETVKTNDVAPETIVLKTGLIGKYKVPVIPKVSISPQSGFIVVGKVMVIPDSIIISGNDKVVSKITQWETIPSEYRDVNRSFQDDVLLKDTLSGIIELSEERVMIVAEVQQFADKEYPDIPVRIVGGKPSSTHRIEPLYVSVSVRAGIEMIDNLNPSDIEVTIDYYSIINDSTGIIRPKVSLPPEMTLLRINPPYIYHYVKDGSMIKPN